MKVAEEEEEGNKYTSDKDSEKVTGNWGHTEEKYMMNEPSRNKDEMEVITVPAHGPSGIVSKLVDSDFKNMPLKLTSVRWIPLTLNPIR